MTQHNQLPDPTEEWEACVPGEIQGVVNSLRRRRRNKQFAQSAAVGTSLVLIVAVTLFSLPGLSGNSNMNVHVMACQEVVQHAEDYVAGQLSALTSQQVEAHLSQCAHCNDYIKDLKLRLDGSDDSASLLQEGNSNELEVSLKSLNGLNKNQILIAAH